MHNLDEQKQAQYEKDKVAFKALSEERQRQATVIAAGFFTGREWITGIERWIPSFIDRSLHEVFKLPYTAAKFALRGISWGWSRVPFLPEKKPDQKAGPVKKILALGIKKTGEFLEYYGALGLYRATKWIMNPVTPSGKPLLGHKKLNKAVGLIAAAAIFTVAGTGLVQLEIISKVWHAEIAHAGLTSTAPIYITLAKQAVFHGLLSFGMTVEKFVVLPVLAAARDTLKSSGFVQGVSYQYNSRLRAKAPEAPGRRFNIIKTSIEQLVEKSSPEFYEVRLAHYQELRKKGTTKPPEPFAIPRVQEKISVLGKLRLGPAFRKAQKAVTALPRPKRALPKWSFILHK